MADQEQIRRIPEKNLPAKESNHVENAESKKDENSKDEAKNSFGASSMDSVDYPKTDESELSDTSMHGSSESVEYTVVIGKSGRVYRIYNVIGKGGYGVVHRAACQMHDGNFILLAVKTESTDSLDIETKVLMRTRKAVHFCPLFDEGYDSFSGKKFIVMGLVGDNLSNLRRQFGRFSLSTVVRVGMQTLHAIEELHNIGYISRDVKPSNFAVGHPNAMRRLIYMLDFGIARRYVDNQGNVLPRRPKTSFRGTSRYCALPQHKESDQCRRDDVESWFYMLVELTVGHLPWSGYSRHEKSKIAAAKRRARTLGRRNFLESCPSQYEVIMDVIDQWPFEMLPDYDGLLVVLSRIMTFYSIGYDDPYDWETLEKYKTVSLVKMRGQHPLLFEHCIFASKSELKNFVKQHNTPHE